MSETPSAVPDSLKPFIERLRSLQSAWSALAPSGVAVAGQSVADSGRVLSEELASRAKVGVPLDDAAREALERQLSDLAKMMGEIAKNVSPAQLRSTLPQRVGPDRRSVLDLLDLLLASLGKTPQAVAGQIGTIDYLVTLLCAGSEGRGIRHDPVTLTPQMNAMCEGVGEQDDPAIAEIEAEFFAASNLEGERLQEEIALRKLRTQKAELGLLYFAPRVLRAVVTYNATLAERFADELWASQDWGSAVEEVVQASSPAGTAAAGDSVFDSAPLRELAEALRRRASDGVPAACDLDRVAWGLDLDFAEGIERKALLRADAGSRENLIGTSILVGLINRSVAVLSIELQSIGILPDSVTDVWVPELCEILQSETNTLLGKDAYQQACVLAELKNKFLLGSSGPMSPPVLASPEPAAAPPPRVAARPRPAAPEKPPAESSARDLVLEALADQTDSGRKGKKSDAASSSRFRQVAQLPLKSLIPAAAAILVLAFVGVQVFGGRDLDPNLDRFDSESLASVSPHLSKGYRNGEGYGPAFVGTIDSRWLELPADVREAAAADLVENLRILGVQQVMIYDRSDRLRIQAIGEQPVRTL